MLRAYSLVEVVLVLSIIGVLSAMVMPRVAGTVRSHRADSAADRVVADMTLAQKTASNRRSPVAIVFDPAMGRVSLPNVPSLRNTAAPYVTELTREPYNASIDLVSCGADQAIIFDGYGTPDSGGFVRVSVGLSVRTISIDGTSGVISVVEDAR